jgi:hypothetical protein
LVGYVASIGREEVYIGSWWGNLRERDQLEDSGVDGRIKLSWIFGKWDGSMKCLDLARNRDSFRALMNAIMNFQVP